MPANKKHLTTSPLHRLLKIVTGFVGGYVITELLFMIFIKWIEDDSSALISLQFIGFMLWASLMIFAFIPKNGWITLAIYLTSSIILAILFIITP